MKFDLELKAELESRAFLEIQTSHFPMGKVSVECERDVAFLKFTEEQHALQLEVRFRAQRDQSENAVNRVLEQLSALLVRLEVDVELGEQATSPPVAAAPIEPLAAPPLISKPAPVQSYLSLVLAGQYSDGGYSAAFWSALTFDSAEFLGPLFVRAAIATNLNEMVATTSGGDVSMRVVDPSMGLGVRAHLSKNWKAEFIAEGHWLFAYVTSTPSAGYTGGEAWLNGPDIGGTVNLRWVPDGQWSVGATVSGDAAIKPLEVTEDGTVFASYGGFRFTAGITTALHF